MPEFIMPAEADHCPHCGKVLVDPPNCCEKMEQEHSEEMHRQNPATPFDDWPGDDCEPCCDSCGGTGYDDDALDDGTEDFDVCRTCGGHG